MNRRSWGTSQRWAGKTRATPGQGLRLGRWQLVQKATPTKRFAGGMGSSASGVGGAGDSRDVRASNRAGARGKKRHRREEELGHDGGDAVGSSIT